MRVFQLLVICLVLLIGTNGVYANPITSTISTAYKAYKFFKKLMVSTADKPLENYSGHQEGMVFLQSCKIKNDNVLVHFMTDMNDPLGIKVFQMVEAACTTGQTLNQLSKNMEVLQGGENWYVSGEKIAARVKRTPPRCVGGRFNSCTAGMDMYISYGKSPNWGWNWSQIKQWGQEAERKLLSCSGECPRRP